MINFIITGNPVSSKNSRPIFVNKATGNRFIGKSEALKEYMDKGLFELKMQILKWCNMSVINYIDERNEKKSIFLPITNPVEIKFTFYVKDNRKRDLVNLCQAPLDLLQKAQIISDDSIVKSLDGSRIYIDKENPRTEIEIKQYELKEELNNLQKGEVNGI